MDHIIFTKMTRVNIKTRNNDLIDDKKFKEVLPLYQASVDCTSITKSQQLPDDFYYLMCHTNNNTQIETETNRHFTEFKEDCNEMS